MVLTLLLSSMLVGGQGYASSLSKENPLPLGLPGLHLVWCDVRPNKPMSAKLVRQLPSLVEQIKLFNFSTRLTLFTSADTVIPATIQALIESSSIRSSDTFPVALDVQYIANGISGYIGKAYALSALSSSTGPGHPVVLFDDDVRLCGDWIGPIRHWWHREGTDVMWTLAQDRCV